jgi:hypothetical protein
MKMQVRDSTFDFLKPLNNLPFEDTSSLLAVALMAIWRAEGLGPEEFDDYLRFFESRVRHQPRSVQFVRSYWSATHVLTNSQRSAVGHLGGTWPACVAATATNGRGRSNVCSSRGALEALAHARTVGFQAAAAESRSG